MNPTQYYTAIILGVTSLIFSVVVVCYSQSNQRLQTEMQSRQTEINRGSSIQQLGTKILQDVGAASLKNEKLKDLLAANGYNVTVNKPAGKPPAAPAASSPSR